MLVFICKVWRGTEQVRSVRLVCGWGRKGTENLMDSPGVTQLEDEVPKCSIHREYSVLGDEREFGDFQQHPASLLLPVPCLDFNICQAFGWGRSCGSRGEGLGWHEDPRQAGRGAAQPSVPGDERSTRVQSTAPSVFLKTWRMLGQATARDWPTGTADQQLTPSHSVKQPGEERDG